MDKKEAIEELSRFLKVMLELFPDPIILDDLIRQQNTLSNYLAAEQEHELLRQWVKKIYGDFAETDLAQDRKELLKGLIRHIERSQETYPMRWNSETILFLEELRRDLMLFEYAAELEFWQLYDK